MMRVVVGFPLPVDVRHGVVLWRALNRVPTDIDPDFTLLPVNRIDPFRRDEHLAAEPPVAGVDHDISDGPVEITEETASTCPSSPSVGVQVIPGHFSAAAEMTIRGADLNR